MSAEKSLNSDVHFWFGLVSLFNGISTLFKLFNAKAILLEEQYYLNHIWEDKGVHISQGYLPESEHNSTTGERTSVRRFRSPSL